MKKVAVVIMPYYRRESPAAELGMIVGVLRREGHEVCVFDVNNGIFIKNFKARRYWRHLHLEPDAVRDADFFSETRQMFDFFASEIVNKKPDAVVFYFYGNTERNSSVLAALIKEKDKGISVIFTSILHRSEEEKKSHILNQDKYMNDFTIIGYDEISLPKLISGIVDCGRLNPETEMEFKRHGKIIDCSDGPLVSSLDLLPFFDFSGLDLNSYKIPNRIEIFTSRGCVWKCKFCRDWNIQGKYRSMSGRRIFDEFSHQAKMHKNVNFIRLVDLAINSDIKALSDFCDLMIENRGNQMPEISWSGDAIIHPGMTRELLVKMRKAGCRGIGYGLESGSENVVKAIGKHFSISIAEEVIRNTHDADIKSSVNIITGFPTETRADFEQTMNFVKRNRGYIDEIRITFVGCHIRKDTELSNRSEELGIVLDNPEHWQTEDGNNTYSERCKRFKQITDFALSSNIELRLGGRIIRKMNEI